MVVRMNDKANKAGKDGSGFICGLACVIADALGWVERCLVLVLVLVLMLGDWRLAIGDRAYVPSALSGSRRACGCAARLLFLRAIA